MSGNGSAETEFAAAPKLKGQLQRAQHATPRYLCETQTHADVQVHTYAASSRSHNRGDRSGILAHDCDPALRRLMQQDLELDVSWGTK